MATEELNVDGSTAVTRCYEAEGGPFMGPFADSVNTAVAIRF